jgi:FkbM family methyltransferase
MSKLKKFFNLNSFIVFGSGNASKPVIQYLRSINKKIIALSDNNPELVGSERQGLKVISPEEISKYVNENTGVVIASSYQRDIYTQLVNKLKIDSSVIFPYMTSMFVSQYGDEAYEVAASNLDALYPLLSDNFSVNYLENLVKFRRYLDPKFLNPNPNQKGFYDYRIQTPILKDGDVVLDCGAYIGDTAEVFLSRANLELVYAVEGMSRNYNKLEQWIRDRNQLNVKPLKIFLGSKEGEVRMSVMDDDAPADPRSSGVLDAEGFYSELVSVRTIDTIFHKKTQRLDLIKIDVEGADLDVLKGGVNTLKDKLPNLMIAGYHTLAHLWEIPQYIRSISDSYRIYAGHHDKCIHEIEFYVTKC